MYESEMAPHPSSGGWQPANDMLRVAAMQYLGAMIQQQREADFWQRSMQREMKVGERLFKKYCKQGYDHDSAMALMERDFIAGARKRWISYFLGYQDLSWIWYTGIWGMLSFMFGIGATFPGFKGWGILGAVVCGFIALMYFVGIALWDNFYAGPRRRADEFLRTQSWYKG